jgi:hypothetical protein
MTTPQTRLQLDRILRMTDPPLIPDPEEVAEPSCTRRAKYELSDERLRELFAMSGGNGEEACRMLGGKPSAAWLRELWMRAGLRPRTTYDRRRKKPASPLPGDDACE